MKYPTSFTLIDRDCPGHDVSVQYDAIKNVYMFEYGDGKPLPHSEAEVTNLIESYYDIEYSYPNQLYFYHSTTTQLYDLVKLPHHNLWACSQDGDHFRGATYTAEDIKNNFDAGNWDEIYEPELTLPFTFYAFGDPNIDRRANRYAEGIVRVASCFGYENYTDENVKRNIEDGIWIIKSVGHQKSAETPTSPPDETVSLAINVDSTQLVEAVEQFKRLAQAIEDVNISLESFQSIMKDTKEMFK